MNVSTSQAWPSGLTLTKLNRTIALTRPRSDGGAEPEPQRRIASDRERHARAEGSRRSSSGRSRRSATLKAQRADDGVLSSALIQLRLG